MFTILCTCNLSQTKTTKINRMKQKVLFLSAILISLITSSCIFSPSIKGNGNVEKQTRNVREFDEIKVSRGMNVYITQGDETKVVVEADENLLSHIETENDGGVLEISARSNIRHAKAKKVHVTTPNLLALKAFAGSNAYSEGTISTGQIEISASAGSNIKLELQAQKTKASASAGSNVTLKGTANSFEGKASSGSNIKAKDLTVESCEAKTSSGANIWITTEKSLSGSANSGGNIFYYGNPQNKDINRSSGGNVIEKED